MAKLIKRSFTYELNSANMCQIPNTNFIAVQGLNDQYENCVFIIDIRNCRVIKFCRIPLSSITNISYISPIQHLVLNDFASHTILLPLQNPSQMTGYLYHEGSVNDTYFYEEERSLLTCGNYPWLYIWRLENSKFTTSTKVYLEEGYKSNSLCVLKDTASVAVYNSEVLLIIDLHSASVVKRLEIAKRKEYNILFGAAYVPAFQCLYLFVGFQELEAEIIVCDCKQEGSELEVIGNKKLGFRPTYFSKTYESKYMWCTMDNTLFKLSLETLGFQVNSLESMGFVAEHDCLALSKKDLVALINQDTSEFSVLNTKYMNFA